MNYLLLMMGGSGTRANLGIPKQFYKVKGKEIYLHILDIISASQLIDKIVVVCPESWLDHVQKQIINNDKFVVTTGGDSRTQSVFNGVKAIEGNLQDRDCILIHDATHPYFDQYAVENLLKCLETKVAATLVTHVWDTVYYSNDNLSISEVTLERKKIAVGASPEGFQYALLKELIKECADQTLDCFTSIGDMLRLKGVPLHLIWSDRPNLKITYRQDMELFEESFNLFITKLC